VLRHVPALVDGLVDAAIETRALAPNRAAASSASRSPRSSGGGDEAHP
jgi:hypothetical protein